MAPGLKGHNLPLVGYWGVQTLVEESLFPVCHDIMYKIVM